ncbi:MAG TPA: hypothetical protein P5181_11495 [Dermatophilaceae bacterium]|nr:hypothetical protein [Dermatophilaceae bacterium]
MSEPTEDPLVQRLREAGPLGAGGVDFEGVRREARRRHGRRQAGRALLATAGVVAVIGIVPQIVRVGVAPSSAGSAAAGPATNAGTGVAAAAADGQTPPPGSERAGATPAAVPSAKPVGGAPGASASAFPTTVAPGSDCPTAVPTAPQGSWTTVPAPPAVPGATGSLVPSGTPRAAYVCRYPQPSLTPGVDPQPAPTVPRSGAVAVAGDLTRLVADLALVDRGPATRACTDMAGPSTYYLLALDYPQGRVWVAAELEVNGCGQAGNGAFTARADLAPSLEAAYRDGRWPGLVGRVVDASCGGPGMTRVGTASQLVPGQVQGVRVCRFDGSTLQSRDLTDNAAKAVIDALRTAATRRGDGSCQGPSRESLVILLRYAAGPPVLVHIELGCRPEVLGDQLVADDGSAVVAAIRAATGW